MTPESPVHLRMITVMVLFLIGMATSALLVGAFWNPPDPSGMSHPDTRLTGTMDSSETSILTFGGKS